MSTPGVLEVVPRVSCFCASAITHIVGTSEFGFFAGCKGTRSRVSFVDNRGKPTNYLWFHLPSHSNAPHLFSFCARLDDISYIASISGQLYRIA